MRIVVLIFISILLTGILLAQTVGPVDINYTLPKAGNVSLAIYDAQDHLLRTLLNADPQSAGAHTVRWDGLDRNWQPVPVGAYTWKLLQTQGLTAEFLLNIGTSTLEHWPGNHGGPCGTLVVGDTLYMTAGNSESPVTSVKLNLATGERLGSWNKYSGWNPITDITYDNTPITLPESSFPEGQLYMPIPIEGRIHLVNPKTGSAATSDYLRNKYKLPTYFAPLMRLDFTDTTVPAQPGWTAVRPEVYSKERGFGWESINGISGFAINGIDGDNTGQLINPTTPTDKTIRTFLVDVPIGGWQQYHVTFYLGHPTQSYPKIGVYGGLSYDNPEKKGEVETKAGEVTTVTYDIKPLPGTQLRLAFGPLADALSTGCAIRGIEISTGADRVDAHKGKVVIGYTISGMVQEITPDAMKTLASYPMPNLRDVALLADGSILALNNKEVVKITTAGQTPVITGLTDPIQLSVDRDTGAIFIAEGGVSQQIKRYAADYQLDKTFGRKGGRQQGLYDAGDFMAVSSLTPDGKGGFVITEAESAPRRTAHFDKNGKLIREWYGGQLWATNAAIDPQHDNRIWLNSHWGWVIEAEVDWTKRTWKPRATYQYDGLAKGLVPQNGGMSQFYRVIYRDGKPYLAASGANPILLRIDEANRKITPVMTSALNITHYWTAQSLFLQGQLGNRNSKFHSYIWNDRNADGDPQPDELAFSTWSNWGPGWSSDDRGSFASIYTTYPSKEKPQSGYEMVTLNPTADGTYPSFDARTTLSLDAVSNIATGRNDTRWLWRDTAQNIYAVTEGSGDGFTGGGVHGAGHATQWPANNTASTAFIKWDAKGRVIWKVGIKAISFDEQLRGQLHAPVKVHGEINGCVAVGDRVVLPLEVWTTDGLYVGGLFDHRAQDNLPANYYAWWRDDRSKYTFDHESPIEYDMVTGGMLFQRKNGEVIYCADGYNTLPTYRVTGWNEFARQQGKLQLTAPAAASAETGTGLTAAYSPSGAVDEMWALNTTDPIIWFGDTERKKLWSDKIPKTGGFKAVWTGFIEPRFSEAYYLHLYVGKTTPLRMPEAAKLWVNGELVLDTTANPKRDGTRLRTLPLALTAGKKFPLRLEYTLTGSGELHLTWESVSQPIEHVSTSALYPAKVE